MGAQEALRGGAATQVLSTLGTAAMRFWPISALAAVAGGALWAEGKASEAARYSEDIDLSFTNLARRTGQDRDLRRVFEPRPGRVREEFERFGYAGEDVAKIAQAYGLPTGVETILSQARFARAYGFGEEPEMIAGLGRRATQLGIAEPAQQGQYWALMAAAVEKGLKHGIDASESMRSLLALTEQSAASMGVVSREYVAGLAGLQAVLQGGESRYFKGEQGAQQIATLLDAFQHPKSIQTQALMMNVLRDYFGKVPSAKELGLTEYRAEAYQGLPEVEKWQFIQERLPELMVNPKASPQARQALGGLVEGVGQGVPAEHSQLLLQALTGLEPSNQVELQQALYEAVVKTGKVGKGEALQMSWPGLLKTLTQLAPEEAKKIYAGVQPKVDLTTAETMRMKDKETMETFSAAVAEASVGLRDFVKDAKLAGAAWLAGVTGKSVADLNASRLEQAAKAAGVPVEALRGMVNTHGEQLLSEEELRQKGARLKQSLTDLPAPLKQPVETETRPSLGLFRRTQEAEQWRYGFVEPALQPDIQHERDRERIEQATQQQYGLTEPMARPYKQSFSPSAGGQLELAPLKIEVSGAIMLEGNAMEGGAARISASVLAEHVIRIVQARLEAAVQTGPTRPAWSQGMV